MSTADAAEGDAFHAGDRVKVRNSGYGTGLIVEERGPLGPGGALIYRVRVARKPRPLFVEVCADQLEKVQ